MFKIGDKVFDNERGYGEGVVDSVHPHSVRVNFNEDNHQTYNPDGSWADDLPITLFKKEEIKNYYYVGQKVSHQAFGDGEVLQVGSNLDTYTVSVKFNIGIRHFTNDGRHSVNEMPSLSQKPHVPLKLEEVVSFEKWELVWAKISFWEARYYSHFDGKEYHVFSNQQKSGSTVSLPIDRVRKFSDNPLI